MNAAAVSVPTPQATDLRFVEVQRRRRWWLPLAIVGVVLVLPRVVALFQHGIGSERGMSEMIFVALYAGIAVLFLRTGLRTRVDGESLLLHAGPFQSQTIPLSSITRVEIATFYPPTDGVWGVHRGRAARIWLDHGDFILVGTRRPEELVRALGR
jgi:hypothetical protein